jgi:predicted phage-related endonuclease
MTPAVREHFYYRADFAAIPDGALLNGEIKTSSFFMAHTWGEEGSENIPINYAAQCMWGLMVTKRAACVVTALIGIDTLIGYPIMRDEETISALREKGADLWLQHILTGVPPDALNMNDLKLIYTNYEGRPVEATPSIVSMIDERIALAKDIKEREERRDELEFQVAKYITDAWGYPPPKKNKDDPIGVDPEDDALLMLNGEQVGSWRRQNAVWLDQQRLKAKHPELVREFTNTTPFRMLRRKKPKKGK